MANWLKLLATEKKVQIQFKFQHHQFAPGGSLSRMNTACHAKTVFVGKLVYQLQWLVDN